MYRGGIDIRLMHLDQWWLCWAYLRTHAQLTDLVEKLKVMGYKKVLEFHHDWNEIVIRRFYATLEVHAENEKLIWMTNTRRFEATFWDLAAAMGLKYRQVKTGKLVADLPMLLPVKYPSFIIRRLPCMVQGVV
jgi:hypothetical protein